jgi:molybdate transport repressor ModE-like protein
MRFDEVDLDLFRHIAEAGSITHGAARANLALTAASMRVRHMEERLGVVLLDRKRHGVTLSPAGRVLLAHGRELLAQIDRLREELSLFHGGLAGQVRVLANTNAYTSFLPEICSRFLRLNSNIDIHITERPSEAIIPSIADGSADIGIVAAEIDVGGLCAKPFATDRYVLITPTDHPLADHAQLDFVRSLDFPFVAGPSHGLFVSKALRLGRNIRTRIKLREDGQVCQLVSEGIGIGIVTLSSAQLALRSWRIRQVELTDSWASRQMFACVRDEGSLSKPARLLFEHLAQVARPAGGA